MQPENCHIFVVGKADDIADKLSSFSPTQKINYYDVEGSWIDPSDMVKALPEGLTAEKVVENYIAAAGGRSKFESLSDISVKMTMDMQGMSIDSEVMRKSPDKFLMSMSMGGNIISKTIFDGTAGKMSGMQGEKTLEGEELEDMRVQALFMPELDYEGAGFVLNLISIEKIDGSDAYKIELKDASGDASMIFYDVESGLKIMEEKTEETPEGPMVQSTKFGDYREVEGIMYPHEMVINFGPQIMTGRISSVQFNSGIEDSVFK
ncbi:hypothetical protein ACFLR8_00345 [Bacteroidota bacterium]